jgi:hypothetical protein
MSQLQVSVSHELRHVVKMNNPVGQIEASKSEQEQGVSNDDGIRPVQNFP